MQQNITQLPKHVKARKNVISPMLTELYQIMAGSLIKIHHNANPLVTGQQPV
jgi:hypothetical protein